MRLMKKALLLTGLLPWIGPALAAGDSAPGAMGNGGMMECEGMMGMMMGGFMIVPMLGGGLLLLVALILGIMALVKYLRHG